MTSTNQKPEDKARDKIDKLLTESGWAVQNRNEINWGASQGIAIREYPTTEGKSADYVLFIDKKPVGIIEAKREEEGRRLSQVEAQSEGYADSKLKYIDNEPLQFIYETTGIVTRFTDRRDPKPRARLVFTFHRPETLKEWLKQDNPLRNRFFDIPELNPQGLRDCQITAIANLEQSFCKNYPRALIQMATGSGKTFTSITAIYRLLKFAKAKRVLFLVDTRNLGEQAEQEFMAYTPNDDNRKFTELYSVQRLKSSYIARDSQVCISTIQRLYSILKEKELEEKAEETNPNELTQPKEPMPVVYSPKLPIEFFDFIVIDECHRSIYNLWKQVLDYFDAFLIGLTATPDKRTFGFFNENVVSEYSHENAVTDGVNVGYDVYVIETEITKQGSKIFANEYIDKRDKLTRKQRWEQTEDEIIYSGTQLNVDIVNKSQIRNIIRAFKEKLPEIFPNRTEVPKTLIFARNDNHAEDIIEIVREEFSEDNAFCKKVTYQSKENPKSILAQFRNDYNPRIAVTVDMIATGTDVKPLECLLFMRDVKSANYFEQMKGRGTRTLESDNLKKVTPSANSAKTHFVIVDAIGVTKSVKTQSRPLERKKGVSLKDLMTGVLMGASDEDSFTSLASRLTRLDRKISDTDREKISKLTNGVTISEIAKKLLNAHDPDIVMNKAKIDHNLSVDDTPTEEQRLSAINSLTDEVSNILTGELIEEIETIRKNTEQIIDVVNLDTVKFTGWDTQAKTNAESYIEDFATFIADNKDEITALSIFYNTPYQQRKITYQMIEEVYEKLKADKPNLAPLRVWEAFEQFEEVKGKKPLNELVALVALIRKVTGIDSILTSYENIVNRNFQRWVFKKQEGALKFNDEQMDWLRMIKEHIFTSFHLEIEDLDYSPFDAQGGLGKMYQLFGADMNTIIDEMNQELVA